MIEYTGPNAEQIRYWNEIAGPRWVALAELICAQIRPLGHRALERAALRQGERALDVGCGIGETTLEIARRVGPTGSVMGIDVSAPMLEHATARAKNEGLHHAAFDNVDAQTAALPEASFDLLFSRFGVMFFAQPTEAFANLRRALRPGARLVFLCWRALSDNPWMHVPAMAAAKHLDMPRPEPHAPGPFAFADAERVRGILERAGFVRFAAEELDETLNLAHGKSLEETTNFLLQMGPAGAALRAANAGPELVSKVAASVRDAIAPHHGEEGCRLPGAAWIITAEVD